MKSSVIPRPSRLLFPAFCVGATLLARPAPGATITQTASDAAGTSSFNAAGNFPGGAPTAGNAYVDNAYNLRGPANGTSYTFAGDSLTIGGPTGRLLFKSTGTTQILTVNNLILNGGTADLATSAGDGAAATLAGALSVTAASGLGALSGETLTVSSAISGGGALNVLGTAVNGDTGTVILTGNNANYTGTVTVGTATANAAGSNANTLFIGNGGTTGSLGGTSSLVNNAVVTFNRTDTITQGTDVSGVISGTGALNQTGKGGTLVLNGTNTYTGQTSIFNGATLSVSSIANNLGAPATGNTAIRLGGSGAAGTLLYTGPGETTTRGLDLAAGSAGSDGVIDQSGTGALVLGGGVVHSGALAHTITFQGSTAGTGTVSGAIVDGNVGGTVYATSVAKAGTGQWTFSTTNAYAGTTAINGGTLAVSAQGALGSTPSVTINAGGTLLLSGSTTITDRVNNAATLTLGGGTLNTGGLAEGTTATAGTSTLTLAASSVINLSGTSLLHLAASGAQTWTGTLSIYNWNGAVNGGGAEQLLFGTTDAAASLTAAQLAQISFYSDNGNTFLGNGRFAGIGDGEVVPTAVPEPSTWAALAFAGGLLVVRRRRVAGWLRLPRVR